MVAYAGMKVPQEESFKVQFILHVRFVATPKVPKFQSMLV